MMEYMNFHTYNIMTSSTFYYLIVLFSNVLIRSTIYERLLKYRNQAIILHHTILLYNTPSPQSIRKLLYTISLPSPYTPSISSPLPYISFFYMTFFHFASLHHNNMYTNYTTICYA